MALSTKQKAPQKTRRFSEPNYICGVKIRAKSSLAVVIGVNSKFSFKKSKMLGEMKAGKVGPKWMFLMPNDNKVNKTLTAFCSYQESTNDNGKSFTSQSKASAKANATLMAE